MVVDADEDHAGAAVVVDVVGEGADGFADGVGGVAGHASLAFDEFGLVVGEQRFQFGIGVSDLHAPLRGPFTLAEGAEVRERWMRTGKTATRLSQRAAIRGSVGPTEEQFDLVAPLVERTVVALELAPDAPR